MRKWCFQVQKRNTLLFCLPQFLGTVTLVFFYTLHLKFTVEHFSWSLVYLQIRVIYYTLINFKSHSKIEILNLLGIASILCVLQVTKINVCLGLFCVNKPYDVRTFVRNAYTWHKFSEIIYN